MVNQTTHARSFRQSASTASRLDPSTKAETKDADEVGTWSFNMEPFQVTAQPLEP